jgi:hypothetical protein
MTPDGLVGIYGTHVPYFDGCLADSGRGWNFEAPCLDLLQSLVAVVVPLVAAVVSSLAVPSKCSNQVLVLRMHYCTSLGDVCMLLSWRIEARQEIVNNLLPLPTSLFSPFVIRDAAEYPRSTPETSLLSSL